MKSFSALTTKKGIALCEQQDGCFLVLNSADDLVALLKLLNEIVYFSPHQEDLFND